MARVFHHCFHVRMFKGSVLDLKERGKQEEEKKTAQRRPEYTHPGEDYTSRERAQVSYVNKRTARQSLFQMKDEKKKHMNHWLRTCGGHTRTFEAKTKNGRKRRQPYSKTRGTQTTSTTYVHLGCRQPLTGNYFQVRPTRFP